MSHEFNDMESEIPIIQIERGTAGQITVPAEKHREAREIVIRDIPKLVVIKGGKIPITPEIMTSAL